MSTTLSDRIKGLHGMSDAEYAAYVGEQRTNIDPTKVVTLYSGPSEFTAAPDPSITRWRRFLQWCNR